MKFLKAPLCLLTSSILLYVDGFAAWSQESRSDVIGLLLVCCLFVGIVWLLAFLPLFLFTRRFEVWGWRKAGSLGSLLGLMLAFVVWRLEPQNCPSGVSAVAGVLMYGLSTGLLFALGTVVSRERWARNLGLALLWILAVGCVAMLVPRRRTTGSPDLTSQSNAGPDGVPWRSTLYPENWAPGYEDSQGRFLQDFSYAGYHAGEAEIPDDPGLKVIDVTRPPYTADRTGGTDATASIQKALDDAGRNGGGIVYLPAGTYAVKPECDSEYALKIASSHVVLRGAGPDATFLYLDETIMSDKSMILASPASYSWTQEMSPSIRITRDLPGPMTALPCQSVAGLSVGDWIVIHSDVTDEFIKEHGMEEYWTSSMWPQLYYRKITSINPSACTITIDAPTRYYLKTRDNARIHKTVPHLEEVGVENLSLGMKENLNFGKGIGTNTISGTIPGPTGRIEVACGLGEEDYRVPNCAAHDLHNCTAITYRHVVNGWIRGVDTYRPRTNTSNWHIQSNGILLQSSRWVTVKGCYFAYPEYRGGGGNGYLFAHMGNDNLITGCTARSGRHNFDFRRMVAAGSVIHGCTAIDGSLPSDFHMHLSVGCLVDSMTLIRDSLEARVRPAGWPLHGHSATQCVFWNIEGRTPADGDGVPVIVEID